MEDDDDSTPPHEVTRPSRYEHKEPATFDDTEPTMHPIRRDDSTSHPIEHPSGNIVLHDDGSTLDSDHRNDDAHHHHGHLVRPSSSDRPVNSPVVVSPRTLPCTTASPTQFEDVAVHNDPHPIRSIDSESECSEEAADVIDDSDRAADHHGQPMTLHVKELDIDLIRPSFKDKYDPSATGSKIVVIGKPGTGKTTLISDLLYRKRFIIPVGQVYSGTEDSNGFYQQLFPSLFVFNRYNEEAVKDFIRRQKTAKSEGVTIPWGLLLLDDCTDNPRILTSPLFQNIFKNGRHWKMLFILSLQYCMDIKPVIRTNVDGVFILRESNLRNRKSLYENYGSCIPSFSMFQMIMDDLTSDYSALYIHNRTTSNNIEDCVFYYKATQHGDFQFGSPDFRKYHNQHYNDVYKDPVVV